MIDYEPPDCPHGANPSDCDECRALLQVRHECDQLQGTAETIRETRGDRPPLTEERKRELMEKAGVPRKATVIIPMVIDWGRFVTIEDACPDNDAGDGRFLCESIRAMDELIADLRQSLSSVVARCKFAHSYGDPTLAAWLAEAEALLNKHW